MCLIIAETQGRSEEVGEWDFESDVGNDSENSSDKDSDSDWTPDEQLKEQDNSNKDESQENPSGVSKASKKDEIRELNVECKFVRGLAGHSLLEDPEGNRYHKSSRNRIYKTGEINKDRIYWRCSYYRFGCKVTAATDGFTLLFTRGEHSNHVKPIHGNTKRREERLRGITKKTGPWNSNSTEEFKKWGTKAEFTRGKLKGSVRLIDPTGHHYNVNKRKADNIVYYRCVEYAWGCKASATTVNDILESTRGPHNHGEVSMIHNKDRDSPRWKKPVLKKNWKSNLPHLKSKSANKQLDLK